MIHVFVGTKAQYIKIAPLLKRMDQAEVEYRLIDSGQHAALAATLRDELGVRAPDCCLGGDRDVTSIPQMFCWIVGVAKYLVSKTILRNKIFGGHSGVCVVHGDTPTTLLSALLARRAGLDIAHVEAGLRTYRWFQPFPEEIIRVVVGRLAGVLFAPSSTAAANLRRSGVKGRIVEQSGNTVLESLRSTEATLNLQANDKLEPPHKSQLRPNSPDLVLKKLEATEVEPVVVTMHRNHEEGRSLRKGIETEVEPVVVTMHRVENLHSRQRREALINLVEKLATTMPVLWIVHGPTKQVIKKATWSRLQSAGVQFKELLLHTNFVRLLASAPFVITDGGSIQEECALLGVPTLIWRDCTDREDGLGSNAVLSCFDIEVVEQFLADPQKYRKPPNIAQINPSQEILFELQKIDGSC